MSWYHDPQWIAIIAAILLACISIFQEIVKRWFIKPELSFKFELAPPLSHKTFLGQKDADTYYFRFSIKNSGNTQMENAEVLINEVLKNDSNGNYLKIDRFSPLNLCWSHSREITKLRIQPGLSKYCDFGHLMKYEDFKRIYRYTPHNRIPTIPESNTLFILDTEVEPNTGAHIIEPGQYKFNILISGNNLPVHSICFKMFIPDQWFDKEEEMLNAVRKDSESVSRL